MLAAIDADATRPRNQRFDFIGNNAFSDTAGELRFRAGVVSGDVDGDGRPDFQIEVADVAALRGGDSCFDRPGRREVPMHATFAGRSEAAGVFLVVAQ